MGPTATTGVEEAVAVDHPVARIGEEEIGWPAAVRRGDVVGHLPERLAVVDGEREDLRAGSVLIIQQVSRLTGLAGAPGSPVAAVEDQDDVLAEAEARARDRRLVPVLGPGGEAGTSPPGGGWLDGAGLGGGPTTGSSLRGLQSRIEPS